MPAYGNALNSSETKALVSFLMTLRGNDLQPAMDASRELTRNSQPVAPQASPATPPVPSVAQQAQTAAPSGQKP